MEWQNKMAKNGIVRNKKQKLKYNKIFKKLANTQKQTI
jgi:hypothetical protein